MEDVLKKFSEYANFRIVLTPEGQVQGEELALALDFNPELGKTSDQVAQVEKVFSELNIKVQVSHQVSLPKKK